MNQPFSDQQIEEALLDCANEPVHVPGRIQPFGWLLAYSLRTHEVSYVSENATGALGRPVEDILGHHVRDLLGREIWHGLQNFLATSQAMLRRFVIGSWRATEDGTSYIVAAWQSGDFVVVEFEEQWQDMLLSAEELQAQTALTHQVQRVGDLHGLLDLTTKQLRHLSGFDRVMIYRFDQDWNGEVIAETCSSALEPFLGLNFPSFDIPAQARDIMARIPLRLIADAESEGVPIRAANPDLPPLDISLGETRATSPVHLEYLRNMGSRATMTLSVVIDGSLWGIISFHHRRARLTPAPIRLILKSFLDVFCLKLGLFTERTFKVLSEDVDMMQEELQSLISKDPSLGDLLDAVGTRLGDAFRACGFYIRSDQGEYTHGEVPPPEIIHRIVAALPAGKASPYFTDKMKDDLLDRDAETAPIAGVAAVFHSDDWMLLIFRPEISQAVAWAGDPKKTIELVDGNARLSPRGSFATFLAETKGRSRPWTGEDRMLAKKLWPMLSAALNSEHKRRYMKDLNRQQELMIDELNHRVRNILALVQSVSTEAKKSESSLQSYSKAIEARIRALAAAHTIGSGSSAKKVDLAEIIVQEARAYEGKAGTRVKLRGDRMAIAPELAPIFALTIHELMTNAAKYGALSNSVGEVLVNMRVAEGDMEISWKEVGGPKVMLPSRTGFGTTLVKRAVPYELGGESSLVFERDGVQALIRLPKQILVATSADENAGYIAPLVGEGIGAPVIPPALTDGIALVVEDNFMIAEGMTQALTNLGFEEVETAANLDIAMEFLDVETPSFAILDVNLGQGRNSFSIAEVLLDRNVPFVFATGYGELSSMAPRLAKQITLTKPIDSLELAHAIVRTVHVE